MPELDFQIALRDSVEEVLEKMFFVQVSAEAPEGTEPAGGALAVKLTFEGSPSGVLTLCLSDSAARQIAADFLGEDEAGLTARQVGDVVCELANMICGSVLSRVESTTSFRLASPRLLAAEQWRNPSPVSGNHAVHAIGIGNGTLTATVEMKEPVCPTAEKSAF